MAQYDPRTFTAKPGFEVVIRSATIQDAQSALALCRFVVEGVRKRELKYDSDYYIDAVVMG